MNKLAEAILIVVAAFLTVLVFNEPGPVWFFLVFLIAYLLRSPLGKITGSPKSRLFAKYIATGIVLGLFIEFFAILSSMKLPPEQRALFNPQPVPDLILAVGYYAALAIGGYFILKRYDFSLKQFFILAGIFGLIAEEHGGIIIQLLMGNILGGIYVFLSYSSFIGLPYLLFSEGFGGFKRKQTIAKYPVALVILAVFYALFLMYYLLVSPLVG